MKEINVKYNDEFLTILEFVKETKDGKYTHEVPVTADYSYQRINIQEQYEIIDEEYQENSYLFGITS